MTLPFCYFTFGPRRLSIFYLVIAPGGRVIVVPVLRVATLIVGEIGCDAWGDWLRNWLRRSFRMCLLGELFGQLLSALFGPGVHHSHQGLFPPRAAPFLKTLYENVLVNGF